MTFRFNSAILSPFIFLIAVAGCGTDRRPDEPRQSKQASVSSDNRIPSQEETINLNSLFGVRDDQAPNRLLRDWITNGPGNKSDETELLFAGSTSTSVEIRTAKISNALLDRLNPNEIEWLKITARDAKVGHGWVKRLPKLRGLSFSAGVEVTAGDLATLEMLPELRWLNLRDTEMSSSTFREVPSLPLLETLHLGGGLVNDANITVMVRFPKLKTVSFERSSVTDAGVVSLRNSNPHLECLDFYGCKSVTEQSLAVLSSFHELKYVALGLTQLAIQVDATRTTDLLKPARVDLGD